MLNIHCPHWYAIRTRSRFEKVVRDQLISRGIDCLLPVCTRMSQWKDRRKRIEWPLFSGYCFGRFGLEQRMQVLQAPGVVQIIGSAHVAEPIPADEIVAIQRLMQSGSSYDTYPYHLQEGMMVTVIRGPLRGLQGRFVRSTSACRLILAVNLIQQAAAVDIAAEDVALSEDQSRLPCPAPCVVYEG
jgi:transcription antitermination factor NusG